MIRSLREVIFDGQKVGHYEVLGEIASGGMATVYLATAEGSSRFIAVKRLHPHMAGEEQFIRMFVDEAFLASRIRHPNVVAILDIDDADGLSIVMEYVDGGTLQAVMNAAEEKSAPIPPGHAVRIVLDVLAGLQAAHDLRGERFELAFDLVERETQAVDPQGLSPRLAGVERFIRHAVSPRRGVHSNSGHRTDAPPQRLPRKPDVERDNPQPTIDHVWARATSSFVPSGPPAPAMSGRPPPRPPTSGAS
jgi:serine/threonine-protein kinase